MKFGVGQSVRRKEDDPLLRGVGRYVADYLPENCLSAVMVRSPHAHARFRLDAAAARAMPGVRLVFTGGDVANIGPLPCDVSFPGVKISVPPYLVLAREEVRHVGDAVAFVVADTLEQAKDAAEAVEIEWQVLPHVVGAVAAMAKDAPQIWSKKSNNVAFEASLGDRRATEKAFARAAKIVSLSLVNQRVVANYLDTRGVVGKYDEAADKLTLTLGSQGSHAVRDTLCAMLNVAPKKLRVVTPDVGGGFGSKLFAYREYALVALSARRLKRPVKWIADQASIFSAMRKVATILRR